MSYFGKKALVWWDYENHTKENATRFNHSDLEIQYQILEKWYPKGMLFKKENSNRIYKITNYVKSIEPWFIEYESIDKDENVKLSIVQNSNTINPVLTFPLIEEVSSIKRGSKLDRLLK